MYQLGVFAKFWEPTRVKTRLAAAIGEVEAANLYRCFLETVLERFSQVADQRVLAYTPVQRKADFAKIAGECWRLEPQSGGDLGQRMAAHLAKAAAAGAIRAVLIGSDSPALPLDTLDRAFEALDSSDVVLGPSEDGGYYLVGVSRQVPAMFTGVQWSSPHVFEQTVALLEQSNLKWSALSASYDVDTIHDLTRLRDELSGYTGDDAALVRLSSAIDLALKVERDG